MGRVAIIGGGIAGCSCAYSLARSGFEVTVYESRDQLGGNAQAFKFPMPNGAQVEQDVSVLYWAPEYYRNYTALVGALGMETLSTQMPYVIHTNVSGQQEYYVQPGAPASLQALAPSIGRRLERDCARYDRMVRHVDAFGDFFSWGSRRKSFYRTNQYSVLPFANPFNFISLKTCARLFGVSQDFYEGVIKPFHGLSLSTVNIDSVPATAYSILEDIAPLRRTREVSTWAAGGSQEVFRRATDQCSVRLNTRVRQVHCEAAGGKWQQVVIDDQGGSSTYDRVVFACPATAASNVLKGTSWIERVLLRGVAYHDEFHETDWRDWLEAAVHQDTSCLPDASSVLLKDAAFLIDVDAHGREDGSINVEYTHNLGVFSHGARSAGVAAEHAHMFMTQSLHAHREIDATRTISQYSAPRSHPSLSTTNMVVTQMLHLVQGRRGVFFSSNWTAPGNGHDLSCTSGLAVASAIGAAYPLKCEEARRDHRDCRRFMCV